MGGGRQSAYGYRYQYLATADHILRYLRNHLGELASIALHVEPTSLAQRGVAADDDIVDLAVEFDGVVVDKVQVKASSDPPNNQLYPGEASSVFGRLRGRAGSRAILLTNRPLSSGLMDKCARNAADDGEVRQKGLPNYRLFRYADLCRSPHKPIYVEFDISPLMPTGGLCRSWRERAGRRGGDGWLVGIIRGCRRGQMLSRNARRASGAR